MGDVGTGVSFDILLSVGVAVGIDGLVGMGSFVAAGGFVGLGVGAGWRGTESFCPLRMLSEERQLAFFSWLTVAPTRREILYNVSPG